MTSENSPQQPVKMSGYGQKLRDTYGGGKQRQKQQIEVVVEKRKSKCAPSAEKSFGLSRLSEKSKASKEITREIEIFERAEEQSEHQKRSAKSGGYPSSKMDSHDTQNDLTESEYASNNPSVLTSSLEKKKATPSGKDITTRVRTISLEAKGA